MNATEWVRATDPDPMLKAVQVKQHRRAVRLFSCACCRRLSSFLPPESLASAEVAERFADGLASRLELDHAHAAANGAVLSLPRDWLWPVTRLRYATGAAAQCSKGVAATTPGAAAIADQAAQAVAIHIAIAVPDREFTRTRDATYTAERAAQAAIAREIFGNPFRPDGFSPAWRTDTVLVLARLIYESCDFGALPILADALQDAGCEDHELLAHCREPGAHVRGCWVLDLVLGKVRAESVCDFVPHMV
jgi:hypothetical protein